MPFFPAERRSFWVRLVSVCLSHRTRQGYETKIWNTDSVEQCWLKTQFLVIVCKLKITHLCLRLCTFYTRKCNLVCVLQIRSQHSYYTVVILLLWLSAKFKLKYHHEMRVCGWCQETFIEGRTPSQDNVPCLSHLWDTDCVLLGKRCRSLFETSLWLLEMILAFQSSFFLLHVRMLNKYSLCCD